MVLDEIEIRKFRCIYKYSYDKEYFYFYWKKGKTVIEEKHPLNQLSDTLDHWKGRPQSTVSNLKKATALIIGGFIVLFSAIEAWMLFITLFAWLLSIKLLFNEIGFFLPESKTVLSYADGDGGVYMFRENSNESRRLEFESGLINAIRHSKIQHET